MKKILNLKNYVLLSLIAIFLFLNFMDAYTSIVLIGLGGTEDNLSFLSFNTVGVSVMDVLIFKIALPIFGCFIVCLLIWKAKKENIVWAQYLAWIILITLTVTYISVVLNNVQQTIYQLEDVDRIFKLHNYR